MSMDDIVRRDARLAILKALGEQPDGTLNSILLRDDLQDRWGVNKTRDWVHDELRHLADLDALSIEKRMETVMIVKLSRKGRDHIERRVLIEGVRRPED